MAIPDALIKYASGSTALDILSSGSLRWSSPELFDEPWAIKHDPKLGFDHIKIYDVMLKTAVAMIFARDLPSGNLEHPLYKAIRRWRAEERFHDETEAYEALSELLAPTPETLEGKLKKIVASWKDLVANARIACFSETIKDVQSWRQHAANHQGVALKFDTAGLLSNPQPVEYSNTRCQLTSIKEQVSDLVGTKRATVIEDFESKLLTKARSDAHEKEWRCIRVIPEEDLDCGEDPEDWYMDEPFQPQELRAVYFGFNAPHDLRTEIAKVIRTSYPTTVMYNAFPLSDQYELDFARATC